MTSFIPVASDSDFTIYNIPFGVFSKGDNRSICSRIGDTIIDLYECSETNIFDGLNIPRSIFASRYMNDFIALGKATTNEVRKRLQAALCTGGYLDNESFRTSDIFLPADEVEMLLPIQIGDYTDFYSSREHAYNVGVMFRDPANALLPNWLHLPVGYHGRASSIVASGTPIKRPNGQTMPDGAEKPIFGPSKQLDFELEMGFVIGKETPMGASISTAEAEEYIFGLMLFNDWSARDIQKWEYVPLGPFLAKNFASTASPWIVTLEALDSFRTGGPDQDPEVLPYLTYEGNKNYDIHLSVDIVTEKGVSQNVSKSNFKYMYWNMCQQLAHHTVNGCNVRVGDLLASGTISGKSPDSYGSMLEIAWKGTKPVQMPDGTERKFIHDGDTVVMRGWCEKDGVRIGFGPCDGKVIG
ncbi:MAG TPA: fumarylacetoacetase [Saprospiraceae bacterium]|nr:fumarylacetoacetase [Saprospiraceae bacterium]